MAATGRVAKGVVVERRRGDVELARDIGDHGVGRQLDRLGRSMAHLIETVRLLDARGVGFRSLTEGVDTTTPGGTLVFHLFGALAQFERDLIRERTNRGAESR